MSPHQQQPCLVVLCLRVFSTFALTYVQHLWTFRELLQIKNKCPLGLRSKWLEFACQRSKVKVTVTLYVPHSFDAIAQKQSDLTKHFLDCNSRSRTVFLTKFHTHTSSTIKLWSDDISCPKGQTSMSPKAWMVDREANNYNAVILFHFLTLDVYHMLM